eukprot:TRINITY_DN836_c0_g1_i4.p1 TRINITY_DN836_c0_g1~~TRINITY_DN836_c0_g1_i4.p1  ORF type:complete len:310 (-),score=78.69 TRINITY_DN836_c0_g1_i4:430-1359(-)
MEEEELLRPAFDVGSELPPSQMPPADGFEYLRRVKWEANRCPGTVVSQINPRDFDHKRTQIIPTKEKTKTPQAFLPLSEWEEEFLAWFSELRQNISAMLTRKPPGPPKHRFPSIKNDEQCLLFCLGKPPELGVPAPQPTSSEDSTSTPSQSSASPNVEKRTASKEKRIPNPPYLSILSQLDELKVNTLLQYHVEWFVEEVEEEKELSTCVSSSSLSSASQATPSSAGSSSTREEVILKRREGQFLWLFALLVRLEKPLDADSASALHSLMSSCCSLRAKLSEKEMALLPHLNVIITICCKYFGQHEPDL